MHVRPIIVVTTMTMTTWRMTLRSCQSRGTAGTSRPRLVTEPSGRDSSDGNHAHKSRNFAPSKTRREVASRRRIVRFICAEDLAAGNSQVRPRASRRVASRRKLRESSGVFESIADTRSTDIQSAERRDPLWKGRDDSFPAVAIRGTARFITCPPLHPSPRRHLGPRCLSSARSAGR